MSRRSEVAALIESVCAERELEWESTGEASYAVTLPGTHKLKTICNLIVGEHALRVEAFVMRQNELIRRCGLPVTWSDADPEQMIAVMKTDKKVAHATLRFVLPSRIGQVELVPCREFARIEDAITAQR